MNFKNLIAVIISGIVFSSCSYFDLRGLNSEREIVFDVNPKTLFRGAVVTKATENVVGDLETNGFKVSAVKGSVGSDIAVFSNANFTLDPSSNLWKSDKWWSASNESWRFYAVYPGSYSMTSTAAGATISASNAHDIVCSYMPNPTFEGNNTLTFNHIFARLGSFTVNAEGGYTISNISITITPKTGGTYNLRTGAGQTNGTGWSNTTNGSATAIANTTPGTKANDIWLVPGTYTLSATWTATKNEYQKTFSGMELNVSLVAGKTNNITVGLTANATATVTVKFDSITLPSFTDIVINAGTVPLRKNGVFNGIMVCPYFLTYTSDGFAVSDKMYLAPTEHVGREAGSYHFNYEDVGKYFDSAGESYVASKSDPIDNANKISYGGYDNWRLMTFDDMWKLIAGSGSIYSPTYRQGSSVNGSSGKKYALITFTDGDNLHQQGALFFPDSNFNFVCPTITHFYNNFYSSSTSHSAPFDEITFDEFNYLIENGCAYLSCYEKRGWSVSSWTTLGSCYIRTVSWDSNSYTKGFIALQYQSTGKYILVQQGENDYMYGTWYLVRDVN